MSFSSRDTLYQFDTIRTVGLAILDGGFATHLEDVLKKDISSSTLWSASLLDNKDGCSAILRTHLDFLQAGAQIISTGTYQASPLSFARAGIDKDTARTLLLRSVDLAGEARKIYLENHSGTIEKPLISLSLGPYGAAQSDGSEYTGIYHDPPSSSGSSSSNNTTIKDDACKPASKEDMIKFHYDRLEILAREPLVWCQIDVLAFETIPRLDEAEAIKQALYRLYSSSSSLQRKPAYVSFVFPNGKRLPYPESKEENQKDTQKHFDEIVKCVLDTNLDCATFDGIGINCTKPYFLPDLVERMTKSVKQNFQENRKGKKPYLFLYPDGGLIWDGLAKEWKEGSKGQEQDLTKPKDQQTWTSKVMEAVKLSGVMRQDRENKSNHDILHSSVWQGCFVGGCCKSTTEDVQSLRNMVQQMQTSLH